MTNQTIKYNVLNLITEEEYEYLRSKLLTANLDNSLRSQIATLENGRGKHTKYLPYVFTEQGVSMLSAVLRSKTAIEMSIKIIDMFVTMRNFLQTNASIFDKIDSIEKRQIIYEIKNDSKVNTILNAIEKNPPQKNHIFYNGQTNEMLNVQFSIFNEKKIA